MDYLHLLFEPEVVVTTLAAIAAFATTLTLGLPYMSADRLGPRMKAVAERRADLRQQHFDSISRGPRAGQTHSAQVSFMRQALAVLKLEQLVASDGMKEKLARAGYRGSGPLITFMFFRIAGPPLVFVAVLLWLFATPNLHWPVNVKILIVAGSTLVGYYLPDLYVSNRMQARRASIMRAFPDALDLLLICIESGMSIEAAFGRVGHEISVQSVELSEELALTTAELSYLPNRRQAFQNLADRSGHPGVKSVTAALIQSEKYGTPLSQALRVAAQENREMRMSEAERKAAALPSKLTAPMILFFLPCLFVVVLGGAMMKIFGYAK